MTTLREAAQQALEALRCVDLQSLVPDYGSGHYSVARLDGPQVKSAITAMEAALAEPVQEPVAWMVYTEGGTSAYVTDNPNDLVGAYRALPLYTTPPQRKPLDDLAVADIYAEWDATPGVSMADFARAVEAAHGIKD